MALRVLSACLAALAAAAVVALPATAHPIDVGVQDDGVFVGHYGSRDAAFKLSSRLHANYVRVMVQSPKIARGRGWDFGEFDALVDSSAAHGMKVQMVLIGPARRPSVHSFALFVAAAVRHFKGRVERYSIWNEPNHKGWLTPVARAPHMYRALYTAGYRVIKRIDPSAQVLIGETVPYAIRDGRTAMAPLRFLRAMLCVDARYRHARCGHVRADGYAHHPYDFLHAPDYRYAGSDNATLGTLGRLTKALDALQRIGALTAPNGGRLPVYLTEYGYFAKGARRVSERTRGHYLVQAFKLAMANPRVHELLQYLLIEPPAGQPGEFFATYLARRDGTPLPSFRTLAAFLRRTTPPTSRAASLRPSRPAWELRMRSSRSHPGPP